MEAMKRCSFKVAKAINEAGYPQPLPPDEVWHYNEGGRLYKGEIKGNRIYAPFAMEVWLWLWREKEIRIEAKFHFDDNGECCWTNGFIDVDYTDPEEAIIAAIEYLVDNDLIK